mgnify:CR=1 FL=1
MGFFVRLIEPIRNQSLEQKIETAGRRAMILLQPVDLKALLSKESRFDESWRKAQALAQSGGQLLYSRSTLQCSAQCRQRW